MKQRKLELDTQAAAEIAELRNQMIAEGSSVAYQAKDPDKPRTYLRGPKGTFMPKTGRHTKAAKQARKIEGQRKKAEREKKRAEKKKAKTIKQLAEMIMERQPLSELLKVCEPLPNEEVVARGLDQAVDLEGIDLLALFSSQKSGKNGKGGEGKEPVERASEISNTNTGVLLADGPEEEIHMATSRASCEDLGVPVHGLPAPVTEEYISTVEIHQGFSDKQLIPDGTAAGMNGGDLSVCTGDPDFDALFVEADVAAVDMYQGITNDQLIPEGTEAGMNAGDLRVYTDNLDTDDLNIDSFFATAEAEISAAGMNRKGPHNALTAGGPYVAGEGGEGGRYSGEEDTTASINFADLCSWEDPYIAGIGAFSGQGEAQADMNQEDHTFPDDNSIPSYEYQIPGLTGNIESFTFDNFWHFPTPHPVLPSEGTAIDPQISQMDHEFFGDEGDQFI